MDAFTVFYILFIVISSIYRILGLVNPKKIQISGMKGKVYARYIFSVQLILFIIIGVASIVEYFTLRKEKINLIISLLGIIMYIFATLGRLQSLKFLGKYWSTDIKIKQGHKLIKEGPYRYIRHPNIAFLLVEISGLCLIPNSYCSLLLVWLGYLPVNLWRIHLEEKVVIEEFGQEYLDYKKEVPALLPLPLIKLKSMKREEKSKEHKTR